MDKSVFKNLKYLILFSGVLYSVGGNCQSNMKNSVVFNVEHIFTQAQDSLYTIHLNVQIINKNNRDLTFEPFMIGHDDSLNHYSNLNIYFIDSLGNKYKYYPALVNDCSPLHLDFCDMIMYSQPEIVILNPFDTFEFEYRLSIGCSFVSKNCYGCSYYKKENEVKLKLEPNITHIEMVCNSSNRNFSSMKCKRRYRKTYNTLNFSSTFYLKY